MLSSPYISHRYWLVTRHLSPHYHHWVITRIVTLISIYHQLILLPMSLADSHWHHWLLITFRHYQYCSAAVIIISIYAMHINIAIYADRLAWLRFTIAICLTLVSSHHYLGLPDRSSSGPINKYWPSDDITKNSHHRSPYQQDTEWGHRRNDDNKPTWITISNEILQNKLSNEQITECINNEWMNDE